jgi:hypothetical protein
MLPAFIVDVKTLEAILWRASGRIPIMPERTPGLDLPERYLETVKRLREERVPDAEAGPMAAGSPARCMRRATSTSCCVPRTDSASRRPLYRSFRQALVKSNLPIRVDVTDWARIPERFHREIERRHVVVQRTRHPGIGLSHNRDP